MPKPNQKTQPKPQSGRAAIYIRVSTADQGERYSLPSQLKALREKAARDGKYVPDEWVFVDKHTGKLSSRPGFDRLKALVKSGGGPDSVYIFDISRFARKTMDALWLAAEFKRHGVKLEFKEQPYEDTPTGRLTFTQMAAVAEFLGEKIIEDSTRGRLEKLQEGQLDHGSACDGYRYIDKRQPNGGHLEINPERARIWQDIFRWRGIDHLAAYTIASKLNSAGILTALGNSWNPSVIRRGLKNSTYCGEHLRAGVIVPCPSIISRDLFDRCQKFREESRLIHVGRPSVRYLLRSYVWCGKCTHRLITSPGSGGHNKDFPRPYYWCGNRDYSYTPPRRRCNAGIAYQDKLEPAAWNAIWQLLKDPNLLFQMAQADFARNKKPASKELTGLERERAKLQTSIETTRHMIQDSLISYAKGKADIRNFEKRVAQIEQELAAAGRVVNLPPLHQIEAALREITDGAEPETYQEQRNILEAIRNLRLMYYDHNLTITGQIPIPTPSLESTTSHEKNAYRGVDPGTYSFPAIPFILKRRVA